jgi:hypothetical protein
MPQALSWLERPQAKITFSEIVAQLRIEGLYGSFMPFFGSFRPSFSSKKLISTPHATPAHAHVYIQFLRFLPAIFRRLDMRECDLVWQRGQPETKAQPPLFG